MKTTACLLAVALVAPVLLFPVAAASLVVCAGLAALVVADYGRSAGPRYAKVGTATGMTAERLPLAA